MSALIAWACALAMIAILALYEARFAFVQRARPHRAARSAHASLREEWFDTVSRQPGSEVLAVQTLRNSLMSASMIASTALLGLMGTVTLAAPSLNAGFGVSAAPLPQFTSRLMVELILLGLLFSSLVTAAMAVRYYNHAGFIGAMTVGSEARKRWHTLGVTYVRRGGLLYSWSLRNLILVLPCVTFILYPAAGPVAALVVTLVLHTFDRIGAATGGDADRPDQH